MISPKLKKNAGKWPCIVNHKVINAHQHQLSLVHWLMTLHKKNGLTVSFLLSWHVMSWLQGLLKNCCTWGYNSFFSSIQSHPIQWYKPSATLWSWSLILFSLYYHIQIWERCNFHYIYIIHFWSSLFVFICWIHNFV